MEFSIRKALAFKSKVLSNIAVKAKAHWGYSDEFMQACKHELVVEELDLVNPQFTYRVAYRDEKILAYAALKELDVNTIELDALFVLPTYIGKGIGKTLFQHFLPLLHASSYEYLHILSDPQASGFYEKMGAEFVESRASSYLAGRSLPLYRLKLHKIEADM